MAKELGLPLGEYLKSHTRRQHLVWLAFLAEEQTTPDLHDLYTMQVAAEVRRSYVKK